MSNKNKNSTGHILTEIFIISLVATFTGFVLGLLFAPQSGREFRKKLVNQFKEVIDRSKFAVVEAKVMAEELIDKSRSKADRIIEGSKEKKDAETD
jgi:gas vesicle protein